MVTLLNQYPYRRNSWIELNHLHKSIVILLLVVSIIPTYGQKLTVSGIISDVETGEILIGATVRGLCGANLSNNMGFFSKSKNAESILADLKEKIGKAKEELAELEEKIKSFDKENEE